MRIFATATAAAVVMGRMASAQHILPDVQVPFQGGNIFKRNDIAIGNYTFAYKEPFEPTQYGGFYSWAVNNNTVAGANFTGPHMPNGYDYIPDGSLNVNPYFLINEGSHKPLNTTKLFGNCKDSRDHARDISPGDLDTQCEGKVHKIVHVVFENEVYDWTIADPFWKLLATKGKSLTNFHAITHPSLPNYAAIIAGDFFGLAHEDFYNINATTIYDLLDLKKVSYATYSEWYNPIATFRGPKDCNNYITNGPVDNTNPDWGSQIYRRLDVPALLFSTYTTDYERCAKLYDANNTFYDHVMNHSLPKYTYFIPDMLHNGHDPESNSDYVHQPQTAAIWFNSWLDLYLPELEAQGALVVATFDEATWTNDNDYTPNNDNHIVTMLFGAGITPDTNDNTYITTYGLLRGAIQNFGLGSLGRNDTNATNGNLYDLVY
ncbi:hypothetical protein TMatcc_009424 [Talaromyces marneffei ATCC 18224]|uniref:Acid phosphatase n=1 Tax=Talaromyces marneffei (strain ATCC 18224 / CBS 334.59 / QM 7333) TaxID=441960 RepID=B6QS98_TALMQ|nr:uncharacterized protein EYB26_008675 [Talaromyces marneffei]EEA19292.1 conserved hypothetical protein [Talaromyces marneffei ATCC 18224]QGA20965.1 hypothetical protein EYB26_008675 [Talaromyces marneffei]